MFEPEVGVLYASKRGMDVTYYLGVECKDTGETKLLMSSAELNSIIADPFCYLRFNSNAWETDYEGNGTWREAGFVVAPRLRRLDDVDLENLAQWDLSERSFVMGSHTINEFQRLLIVALPREFDEHYTF
jgi:hypothetical protein